MNPPDEELMRRWHRHAMRRWKRRERAAWWIALAFAIAGGIASWFIPLWAAIGAPVAVLAALFWWQNRRFEREDLRDRAMMFMGQEPPAEDA